MSAQTSPRIIDLPSFAVRASIAPGSINEDTRSVDVTFSTGAAVKRFDWRNGSYFLEKLSLNPDHIRLDRLNAGAPVLDTHSGWSLSSVLGVVEEGTARATGKQGVATLRFSKRDDVAPIWADVKDKIVRNVSVGYMVYRYEEVTPKDGSLPVRTATDWEPYEISMVPMPADIGAQTRDGKPVGETHPCSIIVRGEAPLDPTHEERTMKPGDTPSETIVERDPLDPGAPLTRKPAEPVKPAEPNEHDRGADAERDRVQGILSACRAARLPYTFSDQMIKDKVPLLRAQSLVFEEIARRDIDVPRSSATGTSVQVGDDPLVHVRAGVENAILHRVSPGFFKLEEVGRNYRGMTLLDVGRAFLQAAGIRTTNLSKMELAGLALGLNVRAGMHTTSDFALLLADVANKTLRKAYDEAPQTFTTIGRRVTLPDFKPVKRLQLGDAPQLLEVGEHGEYQRGTIGEGKEQFQLATYGRVFAITRKALVNDDTDAFSRVAMLFGRAARNLESNLVWSEITDNAAMGDGNNLFSAAHGNLDADGDPISIESLSRARAAMRLQTGLDGVTLLNITPRYLIVPPSLETKADQHVGQITPATAGNANPFSGRLTVLAEPRLEAASAIAWYVGASPDQVDMIEFAYLEGEDGPAVESRIGFDVDGIEIKARHDFAAKVIDWRGFFKNPGGFDS